MGGATRIRWCYLADLDGLFPQMHYRYKSLTQRELNRAYEGPEFELADKYGESVVARGYMSDQSGQIAAVMETWVNGESGTWTVLLTTPAGVSCIAAVGRTFEAVAVIDGDPA